MTLSSTLQKFFSFRTGSTTVLASLFYLTVFVSLYITQYGPQVPSVDRQRTLDLSVDQAYRDLHLVAQRPHPYNSLQNDVVRGFLLQRLQDVAKGHDFIHVDDDIRTNAAFLDSRQAVYFEGSNLLVKVDGTHNSTEGDGVLFSAHFDSVSTAPGATDDGMSVVALLQLVNFLSKNRPRRTAVFNINNGEEDGLHGAHTFLRHPWSDLTSTFINIEGAGSGGRPFLFRTTSYEILRAFRFTPHIHADAISQDAWDQRIIRSDTDYSVYSAPRQWDPTEIGANTSGYVGPGGGMQGADIAFYTGRSRYHTMYDTIRGMGDGGAQRSLWSLMELLRSVSDNILNSESGSIASNEKERAVYFELFGVYLVAFPFHVLLVAEIILLVAGPILLAGLGYILVHQSVFSPLQWSSDFRGFGRFWLALLFGVGSQVGLVVGFLKLNRNTAHSHPIATSLSAFSLAYLSLAIPLQLAQRVRPIPPSRQRSVILVELYGLTWVFLAVVTFLTQRVIIAGLYWIALWNASLLVATILGAFEGLWGTGKAGRIVLPREENESDGEEATPPRARHQQQDDGQSSERTPLLWPRTSPTQSLVLDETVQDRAFFWWIFQFIISTTAPVVNLASIYAIWIGAIPQTIPDGDWVGNVYAPISLLCLLIVLPLAPFVHKVHRLLTLVVLIIFIFSTAYAWMATPFTSNTRLRVFYAHRVDLTNVSATTPRPQLTRAVTRLNAIEGYSSSLAATLPSSQLDSDDSSMNCEAGAKSGLTMCEWAVPPVLHPSIPSAKDDSWLVANVTRRGPASLHVEIEGVESRACRIYVDSHSIKRYRARTVADPQVDWSTLDVPESKERKIHLLTLWARSWETKMFQVDLELDALDEEGAEEPIAGSVSCMWNDGPGGALIPALEEARAFLPEWVAICKVADGLVEAKSGFVL